MAEGILEITVDADDDDTQMRSYTVC